VYPFALGGSDRHEFAMGTSLVIGFIVDLFNAVKRVA
jgi:hypothetical protein